MKLRAINLSRIAMTTVDHCQRIGISEFGHVV